MRSIRAPLVLSLAWIRVPAWAGTGDPASGRTGATPGAAPASVATGPQVEVGQFGYALVRVPPGTYVMGSGRSDVEREHRVTFTRAYAIGAVEVTQGLWTRVTGENPSNFAACGEACPVERVSWCDAVVFANELSRREGLTPAYTLPEAFTRGLEHDRCNTLAGEVRWDPRASGYRLPTEAEWEVAARAGSNDPDRGRDLAAEAWYDQNSGGTTHPAGQKRANAWGLYDMSGNVWEWAWDAVAETLGDATDPMGPTVALLRSYRGGSWLHDADPARVSFRGGRFPGVRNQAVGVRLARTVP
jgi:sulfatase modifying factor 1